MLTVATVACDAFATRRHDLLVAGDDPIFARATVINLVLGGKQAGVVVLHKIVDAHHELRSAAVVELYLAPDIRVRNGLFDRRAAFIRLLEGRFWAFGNSRPTANFLIWTIAIGRRLGGGCAAASGSLGLDFGISISLDRRYFIASRLAAAASLEFI